MDEETIQKRRWAILAVLVICLLVVILDNTILNVALKTIQEDLGASQSQMQWAVDSYALVFAGLLIPAGVFGDRLGRKTVLLVGMLAFGSTSLLCSYAHSSTELILYRALMGIGAALVQPQTLSIIQNVFAPQERAKAIGIWAGASGIAIALGPITGGLLLKYFWWGSIFLVNVPIVILGVIAIWFLVPNSKDPNPGRVNPFSIALLVSALVILVYGVIQGGNTNDWLAWDSIGAILLGAALLAYYVYREARSKNPTVDVHLFRNPQFAAGTAAIGFTFFALMGATFYLAYFMQAVRGYTPLAAGVALIAVAAGVMLLAPRAAKLSERFGARMVTGSGMTLFGAAMISYAFVSGSTPQWVVEIQMFTMGAGMGLTMTPATNAIMGAVPREKAGAGSAVNNTVRQVAGALGVAILGSVLAVVFRGQLGSSAPADLAAKLDQPAAIVAQLPADTKASTYVRGDSSQSIGNAFDFVANAGQALQRRGQLAQAGTLTPAQIAAQKAQATAEINAFVSSSKSSFVDAMGIASICAGLFAWLGAGIAFRYLPKRRLVTEDDAPSGPGSAAEEAAAAAAASAH
jgi:EmrB/QacA subfamily drug resistance transporter